MSEYDIKIGQLWVDNDKRMNGRTLRVTGFVYPPGPAGMYREPLKAIMRVGAGPELYTKISIKRLRTSAFTMVRDEDGRYVSQTLTPSS